MVWIIDATKPYYLSFIPSKQKIYMYLYLISFHIRYILLPYTTPHAVPNRRIAIIICFTPRRSQAIQPLAVGDLITINNAIYEIIILELTTINLTNLLIDVCSML